MSDKEIRIVILAFVTFCTLAGGAMVYTVMQDKSPPTAEDLANDLPTTELQSTPVVKASESKRETTEKFGRVWEFHGPIGEDKWGDAHPLSLESPTAVVWVNQQDPKSRLLVVAAAPDLEDGSPSSQWTKITYEQVLDSSTWRREGVERTIYRDGRVAQHSVKDGVIDGLEQWWAANGQLIKEVTYINGKREGEGKGWYHDGKPEFVATYAGDVETSGTAWRQDGSVVDAPNPVKVEPRKQTIGLQELKRSSIGDSIRTFDFKIMNNSGEDLENLEIEIVCTTLKDKYLGSTKLLVRKLATADSIIEKAMVEIDVRAHELTNIRIVGDHKGKLEIEFLP